MNIPAVISSWLRADATINTQLSDRAYTVLPKQDKIVMPMVLVSRVGGGPVWPQPIDLWEVLVQIEVWGDRKAEVEGLTDEIVQRVARLQGSSHMGANVSSVEFVSIASIMDSSLTPAKPRMVLRFYLRARPSRD